MLDTDALLLKSLVPPRVKPPPWMPMRINDRHPIARGLVFYHPMESAHPLRNLIGNMNYTGRPSVRPQLAGLGIATNGAIIGGLTGAAPRLSTAIGSTVVHVTAGHNAADSQTRVLYHLGPDYAGSVPNPMMVLGAASDNNWYFYQGNGTLSGIVTSCSGDYTAGQSFTVGGRWDSANGIALFVKGASKATAAGWGGGNPTGDGAFALGTNVSAGAAAGTWCRSNSDGIHYVAFWHRQLTDREFWLLERDPYCFLEPDMPAPWFTAATSSDVTLALTGASMTASPGTLTTSRNVAISGAEMTAAGGTVELSRSVPLVGLEAVAAGGTLGVDHSVGLSGAEATVEAGSVGFSPGFALSGAEMVASPGTLTHGRTVAVDGAEATVEAGEILPDREVPLTGAQITILSGVIGGQGEQEVPEERRGEARWRHFRIMP